MKKRKVVLFIAQSLDGYIATKEDSVDWLFEVEGKGDNGYSDFYDTIDTVLMGNRTYEWIMAHGEGQFPYENKACYVFSRSVTGDTKDVSFVNEDIVDFVQNLKKEEGNDIWMVGGGNILHTFFKENLIDELILTVVPKILGEGIPLFKEGDYQLDLTLQGTRTFNQFLEVRYVVKN